MKLINDFFVIVPPTSAEQVTGEAADSGKRLKFKVLLNPSHPIYKVHFPGNPVTPGVCLLQMVTEILECQYPYRFILQSAGNIKFKLPVAPGDSPCFVFDQVEFSGKTLSVRVSIENGERQYAKMSLQYGRAE